MPIYLIAKIRAILGLTARTPFPRCPYNKGRCKNVAGIGTRGDFYGLGERTGHFGVGYCWKHEFKVGPERSLEKARQHMEALRAFGAHNTDPKQFERLTKLQAQNVEQYNEMKKGLELVINTMRDFEKLVKSDRSELTEYISGGKGQPAELAPASEVTRIELALKIAKTLTSVKLDDFKMAADNYIHVDELTLRLPREITLAKRMFAKLIELKANFKEGERNPIEQIEEEYLIGMKEIWKDAKAGEKK